MHSLVVLEAPLIAAVCFLQTVRASAAGSVRGMILPRFHLLLVPKQHHVRAAHRFEIAVKDGRTISLCASSKDECDKWVAALQKCLSDRDAALRAEMVAAGALRPTFPLLPGLIPWALPTSELEQRRETRFEPDLSIAPRWESILSDRLLPASDAAPLLR